MHIRKVLHPEIILNKRGDPGLRFTYQQMLKGIGFQYGDGFYSHNPNWKHLDTNFREHFLICHKFIQERPPVYYVPKDFAQAISKVDREIPVDLLPTRWMGYIAFADQSIFDAEDEIQGAYVYIGPPEETAFSPKRYGEYPVCLWISYVCKDSDHAKAERKQYEDQLSTHGSGHGVMNATPVGRLLVALRAEKLSELIQNIEVTDYSKGQQISLEQEQAKDRSTVYRTLINLVLYINSVGADLVKAPLTDQLSNRQKSERARQGKPVNECSVPLTLISWNYRKPIEYQKGSTWVDTFMRFQRCGPGFKQVKLIWVSPHERHFKKEQDLVLVE